MITLIKFYVIFYLMYEFATTIYDDDDDDDAVATPTESRAVRPPIYASALTVAIK